MIPGTTISMGGQDWVVPPLTLGQLRRLTADVEATRNISSPMDITQEQSDSVVRIVTAALARNYPDLNETKVLDLLDMGNFIPTLTAVLIGSGLFRPGEAGPVAGDLSSSNSPTYMEPSLPAADTSAPQ